MNSTETKHNIDNLKHDLRNTARQILDEVFAEQQVNLIAAPGDSPLCIHAAAAGITPYLLMFLTKRSIGLIAVCVGYPIATVPIGQLRYNNRPFGLCIVAKANQEETLLRFMNAYEKVAKPRPVPIL